MWGRKRYNCNQDKLNMFLEAVEMDNEEVKEKAIELIKNLPKETPSVSDAAEEANKKVQDAEAEADGEVEEPESVEEPVEDEPRDDELKEGVGDKLKAKAKKLINNIDKEIDQQGPGGHLQAIVDKLAVIFAHMTEGEVEGDEVVIVDETKQFSEFDYVINSASAIAEEFKIDEEKVRDMLASEMKHYKESDLTFKDREFSNKLANYALTMKNKKK